MSGFDQSSIAVSMPTVIGADAALGGPYKIKPSEAFSGALMTISGLTGETISVETSPDGYWGAPANPSFYRTDWQGRQRMYSTARTNLSARSQELDLWSSATAGTGVAAVKTANYGVAPDGTTTADRIQVDRGASNTLSDQSYIVSPASIPVSIGQTYRISVWVKTNDASAKSIYFSESVTGGGVASVDGTWSRIHKSVTATSTTLTVRIGARGTIGDQAADLLVWGMQVELDTGTPTAYIPTTTVAVTVTDYSVSGGVITLAEVPATGATLSYDNSVLPSPYYIFATGDGVRSSFAYDGVWGTLSANSGLGNGIWQVDLRGAQAYRLVKSAGAETATVNMTLKRDALQYKNTAGTWSVT